MDIYLTPSPHDRSLLRLFLNGELVAEVVVDRAQTARDWVRELEKARALQSLAWIIGGWREELAHAKDIPDASEKPAARQAAYGRGVEAGLLGETRLHPWGGVPPIPPESGVAFGRGYQLGMALARCTQVIGEAKQEAMQEGP